MMYLCSQSNRRELVLATAGLNGIDYLEVLGAPGCGTELAITFLKDATGLALIPANVVITGDTAVSVTSVAPATAQDRFLVTVQLGQTGDFAPYTLRLAAVQVAADDTVTVTPDPPDGLDPVLSTVTFSFKAGCPSPADCLPASTAPPPLPAPDINYLARDYDSFRQVMLDRLAVLTPAWTERHAADLGIALVEALAYAADHLSYQQDAVGTEAYLGTARSRISLRRHARLVDYLVGEGCNARALITVDTTADDLTLPAGTLFFPAVPGAPAIGVAGGALAAQLSGTAPVFAAIQSVPLATEQDEITFYTWGDENCCLPAGATAATLTAPNGTTHPDGILPSLAPGTILVFEEKLGPGTGAAADADPAHRCAVMLTAVRRTNYQGAPLTDPATGTAIAQVSWADADALPFALCVSATIDGSPVPGISVAYGNVVLADQGPEVTAEALPAVPAAGRYFPQLMQSPVTFAVPFSPPASATDFLTQDPGQAVPVIVLTDSEDNGWTAQPDLLTSGPADRHFVVEVEQDGTAFLRFGDGTNGARPDPGLTFLATYRVGNGTPGNVGRDALGIALVPVTPPFPTESIAGVGNPLPVTSGVDMEAVDHIRQFAPFAFQTQQRCVTEDDYGQQAALLPGVQAARGTLRWTGSWYTALVSVEPVTPALTGQLTSTITQEMSLLPMMGTDVAVEAAIIVGLQISLAVCVDPEHFRGDVYTALMTVFTGPDGLLSAANFTFGQTVYASPLIAAAQVVEGVSSVTLAVFSRMDAPWVDGTADGFLTLGPLDIPRCDNDPDHLDHGVFTLALDGGK